MCGYAATLALIGAVLVNSSLAQSSLEKAVADFRAGRPAQAEQSLRAILGAQPENAAAWKWLGVVYASQSQHDLAEDPFRQACRLAPQDPDACYFHGRNLYALNRFEPALAVLEKALPRDPQPWRLHLATALALEALGRAGESEKQFRVSIGASPQPGRPDDDPRLHFGVFLMRQGRTKEAVSWLERAPQCARASTEIGRALAALEQPAAAVQALERAVALDATYWNAHLLLGKLYLRLGRAADAERHLKLGEKGLTAPSP